MNEIGHIEIPTLDVSESVRFYSAVFGWTCKALPGGTYGLFKPESGVTGGFEPSNMISKDGIMFYVHVESIAKTLSAAVENGGAVVTPKTNHGGEDGFYAVFADPHGNRIGLWSKK